MPTDKLTAESEHLTPRTARDEAQLILGQIHGVIWLAVKEWDWWIEKPEQPESEEPALTADDVRRAGEEIHGHFGTVHAALNTGTFDEQLVSV